MAINPARSTDGSKRVMAMNQPINPTDAAQRADGRSRRSSGPAAAMTKREVLAGHGCQVRQPCVAERLDHRRRLASVVADDQAGEQRRFVGRHRRVG